MGVVLLTIVSSYEMADIQQLLTSKDVNFT